MNILTIARSPTPSQTQRIILRILFDPLKDSILEPLLDIELRTDLANLRQQLQNPLTQKETQMEIATILTSL